MIRSFKDKVTKAVFEREFTKAVSSDLARMAYKKMLLINAATALDELRLPPGNQLELLSGNRKGQHSIRINNQYRICFVWTEDGADDVEITDYH
jgi:toxin HigB-1